MNMNIGCLILRLFLMFIFDLINLLSCLRKLFILIELNAHIFFDYVNDGFTTVLTDTESRGFHR
jgi:hypothetical protein